MERILQCLDELEDLVEAAALQWETLRRRCLGAALVAAALLSVMLTSASWIGLVTVAALPALSTIGAFAFRIPTRPRNTA